MLKRHMPIQSARVSINVVTGLSVAKAIDPRRHHRAPAMTETDQKRVLVYGRDSALGKMDEQCLSPGRTEMGCIV